MTGVYEIRNVVDGKRYIGSSTRCLDKRCKTHLRLLRCGTHPNLYLQHTFDKYGEVNLVFRTLIVCGSHTGKTQTDETRLKRRVTWSRKREELGFKTPVRKRQYV